MLKRRLLLEVLLRTPVIPVNMYTTGLDKTSEENAMTLEAGYQALSCRKTLRLCTSHHWSRHCYGR